MVAARLGTLKLGDNQHSEGLPIGRSSELLNVGQRTVARVNRVGPTQPTASLDVRCASITV
jgi:hypothetical protein